MRRVAVVNPAKLFPPYEEFLTIGTPSLCPDGNWLDPELLIIAAQLENLGHEVKYFDADNMLWDHSETASYILDFEPEVVILTTETIDFARSPLSSYYNVNQICELIKWQNPSIETILYGAHLICDSSGVSEAIDTKIKGEGEAIIPQYLKGTERPNPNKIYYADLDSLPIPAYHLAEDVPVECSEYAAISLKGAKFTQMITSRGCPARCIFCYRHGTGDYIRARSPEKILAELKVLENLGYEAVYPIDDSWAMHDPNWRYDVVDAFAQTSIKWSIQTRVQLARDANLLRKMKDSGCTQVGIGVESYSDEILAEISKGTTIELIDKCMNNLYDVGLDVVAFFMLGIPGETDVHRAVNQDFVQTWKDWGTLVGAGPFLMVPYPMTILHKQIFGYEKGSVLESMDVAGLWETDLDTPLEARRCWYYYDKMFQGDYDVLSQIKKYRPNIYAEFRKYIDETGEEIEDTGLCTTL